MKLVIVESPTKAKTISKYLGSGFSVLSSVGHIRDLPKSNKDAVDIEAGFVPRYVINEEKEEVLDKLKRSVQKADAVYLATDPDREGEAIAWHITQALELNHTKNKKEKTPKRSASKREKNVKRIVFHEITKEAIREALKHPRGIDNKLVKAQEARRVLDRLVGYELSGLIWKKIRYGLSAGRVQSPALRILAEREREIRNFKSETYYVLTADVSGAAKTKFTVTCEEEPKELKKAKAILQKGKQGTWLVRDIHESEVRRSPRAPFTTSSFQQAASSRLGFSPSRAMRAAQKLYEQGLITYMRTDSVTIASSAQVQILKHVSAAYGEHYAQARNYKTKSTSAQEAHEAIRPTDISKEQAGTTDELKKTYRLIRERTIASQMADARLARTKITAGITESDFPDFSVTGSRVLFDGWLACDTRARGEDVELPNVEKNEPLTLHDIAHEEKQTEPPPRYSEARLIKELEKREIGRPSTYATIIKTLYDREYVEREGRAMKPTEVGELVSTFLEENFMQYINDTFTAEMEHELDDIAEGKREYVKTLKDFYTPFHKDVQSKEHIDKITDLGEAPKKWKCPKCNSSMVIKLGRGGKFMSCSRFPDCDGARRMDGSVVEPQKPIGTDPETNLPVFVLEGRYGPYVQLGEKTKSHPKPKRSSVPKDKDPSSVTLKDALKYLQLPRTLGTHPETGKDIIANIGRFGPYIGHDGDFRSLKNDDVYTIELPRALEILKEPKTKKRTRDKTKKTRATAKK